MKRILEPELMLDEAQTVAYSNADFSSSNTLFVDYILQNITNQSTKILDLGCGPADVDIELATQFNKSEIFAIDGSSQMIQLANRKIEAHNLNKRIKTFVGKIPNLDIQTGIFDLIISKDLLHHIPEPQDFWYEVERLSNVNTIVFVMDLIRPESVEKAREIVKSTSSDEPEILKTDFYNSLLAAFTLDEINKQLEEMHLNFEIEKLGDRHFICKCWKG